MFEELFDDDLKKAMQLNSEDSIDLWSNVNRRLPTKFQWLDYLTPLAAAAAAIFIATVLTTPKGQTSWPVNGNTIMETQVATLK